jgi:hypothetical protein
VKKTYNPGSTLVMIGVPSILPGMGSDIQRCLLVGCDIAMIRLKPNARGQTRSRVNFYLEAAAS